MSKIDEINEQISLKEALMKRLPKNKKPFYMLQKQALEIVANTEGINLASISVKTRNRAIKSMIQRIEGREKSKK